jgi:hypothetical protein
MTHKVSDGAMATERGAMGRVHSSAKLAFAAAFLVFAPALAANRSAQSASPAQNPPAKTEAAACSAPEYRQFDFWLGDWDAFEFVGGATVARTHVDSILKGCVLHEIYEQPDGYRGESFTIYDVTRKVWHQSWVTNRGRLLTIEGTMQNGEITLSGVDRTDEGAERHVRGTWKPVSGGVRETAFTSTDGGATWKPWFDLIFKLHK